eukprot:3651709-Rhodomonas_salina.1
MRRQRREERPRGCGVEEEGKSREGAVSKKEGGTAKVLRRRGREGPRGCGVEGEKRTAPVWRQRWREAVSQRGNRGGERPRECGIPPEALPGGGREEREREGQRASRRRETARVRRRRRDEEKLLELR